MKSLAINMLSYNTGNLIGKAIEAFLPFTNEIHIIDTGSTDNAVEVIKRYPVDLEVIDLTDLGVAWVDREKNVVLTELLNKLKSKSKADWILRADDDEVYPEDLMQEVMNIPDEPHEVYSLRYMHVEGDHILNPRLHKNLRVARLFKNLPKYNWSGDYGREVISIGTKRIGSNKCPILRHSFIHLGEFREGLWKHDYRYHEKGHCGVPIPDVYKKYIPIQHNS
jgi:glycosyltransferase involved in cell wall biosynthesis